MRFVTHEVPYVAGETPNESNKIYCSQKKTATFKVALIL